VSPAGLSTGRSEVFRPSTAPLTAGFRLLAGSGFFLLYSELPNCALLCAGLRRGLAERVPGFGRGGPPGSVALGGCGVAGAQTPRHGDCPWELLNTTRSFFRHLNDRFRSPPTWEACNRGWSFVILGGAWRASRWSALPGANWEGDRRAWPWRATARRPSRPARLLPSRPAASAAYCRARLHPLHPGPEPAPHGGGACRGNIPNGRSSAGAAVPRGPMLAEPYSGLLPAAARASRPDRYRSGRECGQLLLEPASPMPFSSSSLPTGGARPRCGLLGRAPPVPLTEVAAKARQRLCLLKSGAPGRNDPRHVTTRASLPIVAGCRVHPRPARARPPRAPPPSEPSTRPGAEGGAPRRTRRRTRNRCP